MSQEAMSFFSDDTIAQTKCVALQSHHEQALSWENISVSKFSPGTVTNDEILVRAMFDPIHVDKETGEIKPTAYDDAIDKGLSTNRHKYSELYEIEIKAIEQAKEASKTRTPREYLGYVIASVSNIRNQYVYEKRIFAVFDTSLFDDISHADVCTILSKDHHEALTRKSVKKLIRGRLSDCFSEQIQRVNLDAS